MEEFNISIQQKFEFYNKNIMLESLYLDGNILMTNDCLKKLRNLKELFINNNNEITNNEM